MKNCLTSRFSAGFFCLAISGMLLAGPANAVAWSNSFGDRLSSCSKGRDADPESLLGEHYSPEENLESIDVDLIDHARQSIEIAMYAFTDRPIADALIRAASRGVGIFIYRDGIQIRDRGDKSRRILSAVGRHSDVLIGVKRNYSRNIMHLKAYLVDGKFLRTGSANWSPPGEGAYGCRRHPRTCHRGRWQQDNNLFLSNDRRLAEEFRRTFNRLWNRSSNLRNPRALLERLSHHGRRRERDGSRY